MNETNGFHLEDHEVAVRSQKFALNATGTSGVPMDISEDFNGHASFNGRDTPGSTIKLSPTVVEKKISAIAEMPEFETAADCIDSIKELISGMVNALNKIPKFCGATLVRDGEEALAELASVYSELRRLDESVSSVVSSADRVSKHTATLPDTRNSKSSPAVTNGVHDPPSSNQKSSGSKKNTSKSSSAEKTLNLTEEDRTRLGELLLDATGDVDVTNLEKLIREGADVNFCDPAAGITPLLKACRTGNEKAARVLVAEGAEVNTITDQGDSALHAAARRGFLGIVELLLKHGADRDVPNKNGVTPRSLAEKNLEAKKLFETPEKNVERRSIVPETPEKDEMKSDELNVSDALFSKSPVASYRKPPVKSKAITSPAKAISPVIESNSTEPPSESDSTQAPKSRNRSLGTRKAGGVSNGKIAKDAVESQSEPEVDEKVGSRRTSSNKKVTNLLDSSDSESEAEIRGKKSAEKNPKKTAVEIKKPVQKIKSAEKQPEKEELDASESEEEIVSNKTKPVVGKAGRTLAKKNVKSPPAASKKKPNSKTETKDLPVEDESDSDQSEEFPVKKIQKKSGNVEKKSSDKKSPVKATKKTEESDASDEDEKPVSPNKTSKLNGKLEAVLKKKVEPKSKKAAGKKNQVVDDSSEEEGHVSPKKPASGEKSSGSKAAVKPKSSEKKAAKEPELEMEEPEVEEEKPKKGRGIVKKAVAKPIKSTKKTEAPTSSTEANAGTPLPKKKTLPEDSLSDESEPEIAPQAVKAKTVKSRVEVGEKAVLGRGKRKSSVVGSPLKYSLNKAGPSSANDEPVPPVASRGKRSLAVSLKDTPRKTQKTASESRPEAGEKDEDDIGDKDLLIYAASTVSEDDKAKFIKECMALGWSYTSEYRAEVSHVIVAADNGFSKRTINLLESMLQGCWIVDKKWLDQSIQKKGLLPEKAFELRGLSKTSGVEKGPESARINMAKKGVKLFEGLQFFFKGNLKKVKLADLKRLVEGGGGTVVSTEPKKRSTKKAAQPHEHADPDNAVAFCQNFIVTEPGDGASSPMLISNGCAGVTSIWILDSIEAFHLVDI